jgi:hypothetical protein
MLYTLHAIPALDMASNTIECSAELHTRPRLELPQDTLLGLHSAPQNTLRCFAEILLVSVFRETQGRRTHYYTEARRHFQARLHGKPYLKRQGGKASKQATSTRPHTHLPTSPHTSKNTETYLCWKYALCK